MLGVAHLGAGLLAMTVPLPWMVRIPLWLTLAWSLVCSLRRYAWRADARAVTDLEIDREGLCAVRRGNGGRWENGVITRAVVRPWAVLLTVKFDGRRRSEHLLIPGDAVDSGPFRQLRARLRLETRAA